MPNMIDYLTWRGDLPLSASPWNEVDSLLAAALSYCVPESAKGATLSALTAVTDRGGDLPFFTRCRDLQTRLGQTVRFGGLRIIDATEIWDTEREIQFAAITLGLPDGSVFIAYRGTDSTIVGWREDFAMAYDSAVPAQQEALTYLERTALTRPAGILVGGHSKGGNLALFAAAGASPEAQALLRGVYSFDGPGLSPELPDTPGYQRIRPLIRSYIPQSSVVGLLLGYHPDYTVVHSKALSLMQHDPFTWQLDGPHFAVVAGVDAASQLLDETVREWLAAASPEQRRTFIDALFSILEATGAQTLGEIRSDRFRSGAAMVIAGLSLDNETKKMLIRLTAQFVRIGTTNIWERLTQRAPALPGNTDDNE